MKPVLRMTATVLAIALLSGCGQNNNFVRPAPDALTLGKSRYSDVVKLLGEPPFKSRSLTINNEPIYTANYRYHKVAKFVGLVAPERFLHFSFFNDVLVGEEFVSSFDEDSTQFDLDKVFSLENGKSTRADVIRALGKPSGEIIYPLVKDKTGSGLVYWYAVSRPAFVYVSKTYRLIVFLDGKGLVTDISYKEDYGKEQFPGHATSWPSDPLGASFLSY